jgi:hypothetical protein
VAEPSPPWEFLLLLFGGEGLLTGLPVVAVGSRWRLLNVRQNITNWLATNRCDSAIDNAKFSALSLRQPRDCYYLIVQERSVVFGAVQQTLARAG